MQVVDERWGGLDVHKRTVVACVRITRPDGTVHRQVRPFATMTADVCALRAWLAGWGVTHVALESTGVYGQPVFNILEEGRRTILLVNAPQLQRLPGRKTDVRDAEWLADLLRPGLLRARCIPPAPIRDLRDLTRYRKTLGQEHTAAGNRLHTVLEAANLTLGAVAPDLLGASGRELLAALLTGERDPDVLADVARGKRRAKRPDLRRAFVGRVKPHHLVLSARILAHLDFLEQSIAQVQDEIEQALAPVEQAVGLLDGIPWVGRTAAAAMVAESGTAMRRFPADKHLTSWAGVCPGSKQSGGKRLSGKTTKGSPGLRAVLGEVAQAIARCPGPYLHAQYQRSARRRGQPKALTAVAQSVLVSADHMLRDKRPYPPWARTTSTSSTQPVSRGIMSTASRSSASPSRSRPSRQPNASGPTGICTGTGGASY